MTPTRGRPGQAAIADVSASPQRAIPRRSCQTDLCRRVLLDEMKAGYRHLRLIGPAATEFALIRRNGSGLGIDEELRNWTHYQPPGIRLNDFDHIGRVALD